MSTAFIKGVTATGDIIPLLLNPDGSMAGGGSDATATNQTTQITRLEEIRSRLDDIKTYTDGLESAIATLNSYTDGLEALLATANSTSTAIASYVDGLEGYTDQIEGLSIAVRDRLPSTLVGDRLKTTSLLEAGESFIGTVGGKTALSQASFTRPADTTAYAVGDAVSTSTSAGALITFANAARIVAGSGIIVGARMAKSSNAIANATFRLWLYTSAPTPIPNDNAAFGQSWANRALRLGCIDFTSPIAGSDCASYFGSFTNAQLAFKLASGTSIFGILQTLGAYSPASGEQIFLELSILQD